MSMERINQYNLHQLYMAMLTNTLPYVAIAPAASTDPTPTVAILVLPDDSQEDEQDKVTALSNAMNQAWTQWPDATTWALIATPNQPTSTATPPLRQFTGATRLLTFHSDIAA